MKVLAYLILFIYKVLTLLIAPLGVLFLCYKKRRDPPYGKRVFELLGLVNASYRRSIWFHTVSVGEVIAARPVIEAFVARHKNLNVIVTTTTTTGALEAMKIKGITHYFAPLDSPLALALFTMRVKPSHLFIMETELWPNMLDCAYRHKTQVIVFNARMPEKTCLKYEKYLPIVKELISKKINTVIAQTEDDAKRFIRIGLPSHNVFVANSLKYDLKPREHLFKASREIKQKNGNPIVIGAISTHDGEEELILETFFTLCNEYENLHLVLVPRHKSGVEKAIAFLKDVNSPFVQKSGIKDESEFFKENVLIGDTMGEIECYFGLCDIIFMGGSLIDIGGHNPLEPAYFSLPIITGPFYYNFNEQYTLLIDEEGAYLAQDHKRLYNVFKMFIDDEKLRVLTGLKALDVQQRGKGAIENTLKYFELALTKEGVSDDSDRTQDTLK